MAFKEDGTSGVVDVTKDSAEAAMKKIVNDEKVTIELPSIANAKEQTVQVTAGSVTKTAKVNLTVVPNKNNGQKLTFTGTVEQLQVIVYEGGQNTRYTLAQLKDHTDANIKALANKITVTEQTITIPTELLTTAQWKQIKEKEGSNILRAYRLTIVDNGQKIGKIAMYENGKAVIETK